MIVLYGKDKNISVIDTEFYVLNDFLGYWHEEENATNNHFIAG